MNVRAHRLVGAALVLVGAGCAGSSGTGTDASAPRTAQHVAAGPAVTAGWTTDFRRHLVPLSDFQQGGPGKDGIPAIDHPRFAPAVRTAFLRPREPVIELDVGGEARAYPLQIMVWHEIVNDTVAGVPVVVTFCPLCDTSIVFVRRAGGRVLDFGTTGDLRNSDLVMYDRRTQSWWQQFTGQALVGALAGTRLRQVPSRIVSWAEFRRRHPTGLVLSRDTGYSRPYGTNPYPGYGSIDSPPFFPVDHGNDHRLPPKERVVYVERDGHAAAVGYSLLARRRRLTFTLAGERLTATWTPVWHRPWMPPRSPPGPTSDRWSSETPPAAPWCSTRRSGSPLRPSGQTSTSSGLRVGPRRVPMPVRRGGARHRAHPRAS